MQLIFSDQSPPRLMTKSIFLAGPSPRNHHTTDWRHEALDQLKTQGFDGTVFIPVPSERFYGKDDSPEWTYETQVAWECNSRAISDLILFWIPRTIDHTQVDLGMPAFTTNVEFGEDLHSGKIVYGRPPNAEKCRYLDQRILSIHQPIHSDLASLIRTALSTLGPGALRTNGEIHVPLFIWHTTSFQTWYTQLKENGNRLTYANVLHHTQTPNGTLFSFILSVHVWITSEQRLKQNEFVFSRPDISSILPYYTENNETFVLLVKEFRSPVRNSSGFVYELPGGSHPTSGVSPLDNAKHELQEETGIHIQDVSRFILIDDRQLCSTLSSHHGHLYRVALTLDEFTQAQRHADQQTTFGLTEDSEQTSLVIAPLSQLTSYPLDYSMMGMIFRALFFDTHDSIE